MGFSAKAEAMWKEVERVQKRTQLQHLVLLFLTAVIGKT